MRSMYKNNEVFMEELDKFNQDYEKYKRRYKLLLDELPTANYDYNGKTISDFPIEPKKRKVFIYKKDINGKLF